MNPEQIRKSLGTAAGGIAGAKIGRDSSKTHPNWGTVGGGFVGAVAGLFSAEIVNALATMAASRGTASASASDESSAADSDLAELRGLARGLTLSGCALAALAETPAFWEALYELVAGQKDRTDEEIATLFTTLLRENKEILYGLFERRVRRQYETIRATSETAGYPLQLPYEDDPQFLENSLESWLNRQTK